MDLAPHHKYSFRGAAAPKKPRADARAPPTIQTQHVDGAVDRRDTYATDTPSMDLAPRHKYSFRGAAAHGHL